LTWIDGLRHNIISLLCIVPVVTFFMAVLCRTDKPQCDIFWNMVLISVGVIIASAGEVHFNIIGVFFQISGIMAEALRLVLTQVLLQKKGLSLNPLTSLYYIAPCRYGTHQDRSPHSLCSFTLCTFLCRFERKKYVHLNLGWCSFACLAIHGRCWRDQ
jgi:hypothetical protein